MGETIVQFRSVIGNFAYNLAALREFVEQIGSFLEKQLTDAFKGQVGDWAPSC